MPIAPRTYTPLFVDTSKGVILQAGTAPSETIYVTRTTFQNTNAATQTLHLYFLKSGGSSANLHTVSLPQNWSCVLSGLVLEPGDAIEADTTTGSAVKCTPMGGVDA